MGKCFDKQTAAIILTTLYLNNTKKSTCMMLFCRSSGICFHPKNKPSPAFSSPCRKNPLLLIMEMSGPKWTRTIDLTLIRRAL